jgi:tetratricopeptide (TPR) repeat protein
MLRVLWFFLLLLSAIVRAGVSADALHHFQVGEGYYEGGNYEAAAEAFRKAIEAAPMESEYHRQLGRAYGRLAEEANWFTALGLVSKTRKQLERAVELNAKNLKAISDLIDFYEQAPGLLGGSGSGAKRLRAHLETVCAQPNELSDSIVCVEQLRQQ